jgi:hypothetical protein
MKSLFQLDPTSKTDKRFEMMSPIQRLRRLTAPALFALFLAGCGGGGGGDTSSSTGNQDGSEQASTECNWDQSAWNECEWSS